ncbi:ribose 5-phosphate isomerase A (phosphoriboisomerase a) domain-containing protein [Ditylenchus destructor]|nr:ribose 5-phosphate isomerase A (phosphoriboisomerase a) domain-containing protein [Ditylenchus destructor]
MWPCRSTGPAVKRGSPFVTDGGHYIVDASLAAFPIQKILSDALFAIPGVVEHGLFIGLARAAIIAGADGIRTMNRP